MNPTDAEARAAGRAVPPEPNGRPSVTTLLGELLDDSKSLVQDEVRLAKAEIQETLSILLKNTVIMIAGGVVLIAGALVLASAVNRGLTSLFAQFMSVEVAVWLAPLTLAIVLLLVGGILVKKGLDTIKKQSLVPRRTTATLKEDKTWLKERLS